MNLPELEIRPLNSSEEIPFELLLLADDEIQAIEKYIYRSEVLVANAPMSKAPIGVIALLPIDSSILEIKALAVSTIFHNQGIGKRLIATAKRIACERGFRELHVGTADCAFKELDFYTRCGFQRFAVKHNFFIENYTKPLFENGIQLKDMVMFRILLSY
ncbi:MAG TPA: GNAT family N-acetyltransferase [Cyclobacteriaceae bacterium]|nr:GNAT family N-acetyltransferase [Cyclobacteriaceae bacterium]